MNKKDKFAGVVFIIALILGLWNVDQGSKLVWPIVFVSIFGASVLLGYSFLKKKDQFDSVEALRRINKESEPLDWHKESWPHRS